MPPLAYALREAYAGTVEQTINGETRTVPTFLGGLLSVDDQRDISIAEELAAGNGVIVVDESDGALVRTLDAYPPLKRVAAPADAAPAVGKYDGLNAEALADELARRRLKVPARKADRVALLEAHDTAVDGELAAFTAEHGTDPTPEA